MKGDSEDDHIHDSVSIITTAFAAMYNAINITAAPADCSDLPDWPSGPDILQSVATHMKRGDRPLMQFLGDRILSDEKLHESEEIDIIYMYVAIIG